MESAPRIFIVEDEAVVSMDLETSLQRLGYVVAGCAISGEEALREIGRRAPDLVLMDIQLRGAMDGLATAKVVHQRFDLPIVFVTANVSDETIARTKQSGSYGYLNKPFRPSELNATVEIALNQHRSGRSLSAERERLKKQVHLTSTALGQTREELQALSRHLMQVQEEERARIARELHDDLGQQTALLGLQVDLLERELPADGQRALGTLRSGLQTLADSLREVSHRLHPSIIADLGLTPALDALAGEFRSKGLAIQTSLAWVEAASLDVRTAVYRIAQESLNNVLKHAPGSSVMMTLAFIGPELHLLIADDGEGFRLDERRQRGGLGLISMAERARLAGGSLALESKPGRGTTVVLCVPSPGETPISFD